MDQLDFLSVGELAEAFAQPEYRIRRIVDRIAPPVPRFAGKRAVPRQRVGEVVAALQERGWLSDRGGRSR